MMTTLLGRTVLTIVATALVSGAAPAAEVSGRILGDGAKPVAHAVVRLMGDGAATPRPGKAVRVETGEDGGFVAKGLTGELFRVRVVHRGGGSVAGAQVAFRPVPVFPGCEVVRERNRPKTTDADGATLVTPLYPGAYLVSIVGRRDTAAVQVGVDEGTESNVVLEVP
jgi:hypothetical protein